MMSGALARREPCVACGQPVFLAQRLLVDRRLYHRTCFRCARCGAQLTLSGCYQTETDGQYCCETCPDEEVDSFMTEDSYTDMDKNSSLNQFDEIKSNKTLSDEEKFNLKSLDDVEKKVNVNDDNKINPKWESSAAFTGFVSNYLHQKDSDDEDVLPALPTSLPPNTSSILYERESKNVKDIDLKLSGMLNYSDQCSSVKSEEKQPVTENNILSDSINNDKLIISDNSVNMCEKKISVLVNDEKLLNHDIDKNICEQIDFVNVEKDVNIASDQLETASFPKENENKLKENIKKEIINNFAKDGTENIPENIDRNKEIIDNSEVSLVKTRMKMFEGNNKISIDSSTQYGKIKNSNNQLYDDHVNSNNRKSDSQSDKNNLSNVILESNSLGEIEILKNSSDIKSDEYNIEVPCSDVTLIVPLNEDENLSSTDKFYDIHTELTPDAISDVSTHKIDTELTPDAISDVSTHKIDTELIPDATSDVSMHKIDTELIPGAISDINTHKIDTQSSDISQNDENSKENDNTCDVNEEFEKNIEDLDTVSQEKQLPNQAEINIVENIVLDKPNIVPSENDQSSTIVENISEKKLATDETKYEKDEDKKENDYPEHLNPFDDEGDDENLDKSENSKNPFECSSDENEEVETLGKPNASVKKKNSVKPPRPPPPVFLLNSNKTSTARRVIAAPAVSLNPFSSDEDGNSEDENMSVRTPIPTPRQSLKDSNSSSTSFLGIEPQSFHGSSSSLSSTVSRRKKGQAPKPPSLVDGSITKKDNLYENTDDTKNTLTTSDFSTRDHGSISPRSRKRRPAPLPPTTNMQTSLNSTESLSYERNLNSFDQQLKTNNLYCSTPILKTDKTDISLLSSKRIISSADFDNDPDFSVTDVWEKKVSEKEEKNNELNLEKEEEIMPLHHNKSTSGQWKRRKGPAPAIPLLQRRTPGPPMPPAVLRRELQMLEAQQRGLEKQGVRLEELIRDRCENNECTDETSTEPDPETDELVLQLFELVNEKNELFRRQSELMYIRRQQRLEEEHADLEHQIRILMARPEANKTDSDKAKEEQLIQRLVEVVERRNEVITSLEMDRLREKEEDKTIRERMASHRAKRDENSSISSLESHNKETLKLEKKKNKKTWIKKGKMKKNDAGNDPSEERPEQTVQKEKKHKKWF